MSLCSTLSKCALLESAGRAKGLASAHHIHIKVSPKESFTFHNVMSMNMSDLCDPESFFPFSIIPKLHSPTTLIPIQTVII